MTNNLAQYYVATSERRAIFHSIIIIINMGDCLHELVYIVCLPRLLHSNALKIHLACRFRPRHREDAYIVIRYMSPAPPIITCNILCSTIRRLIVWRVKMACTRRTEVRIMAVSLLFNYSTSTFHIMCNRAPFIPICKIEQELPSIVPRILILNIIIIKF